MLIEELMHSLNKPSRLRFVTLHSKTAFLFAVGLAGIIFSSVFLFRYFFLYSLNELENIEIHKASSQAYSVIHSLSVRQEEASHDWAYWSETYDFSPNRIPVSKNATYTSIALILWVLILCLSLTADLRLWPVLVGT